MSSIVIQKADDKNKFILRTGSYGMTIDKEIKLLEECLEHLKKNSFTNTIESSSSTAITTATPSVISEARIERCTPELEVGLLKNYIEDMIERLKEIQS